jgi:hypothetical protein
MTLNYVACPWTQRNILQFKVFQDVWIPGIPQILFNWCHLKLKTPCKIQSLREVETRVWQQTLNPRHVGLNLGWELLSAAKMRYEFCLTYFENFLTLELTRELLFCDYASKDKLIYVDDAQYKENWQRLPYHVFSFKGLLVNSTEIWLFNNQAFEALLSKTWIKTGDNWISLLVFRLYNLNFK